MKNILKKLIGWENKNAGGINEAVKKMLSWDIDIALRYKPVISFINKYTDRNETILEVGCSSRGLANYVKREIIGADVCFDGVKLSNLRQVRAIGDKLPFKDKEFDIVVCIDVLEHVKEEDRFNVVREIFRVSKRYVVLGAPAGKPAHELDKSYDMKFNKIFGKEHKYIKEHLKYGLPDIEKYLNNIKARRFKVVSVVYNAPVFLWKIININFINRGFWVNGLFMLMSPFFNLLKGKDYYRKIYFIEITG